MQTRLTFHPWFWPGLPENQRNAMDALYKMMLCYQDGRTITFNGFQFLDVVRFILRDDHHHADLPSIIDFPALEKKMFVDMDVIRSFVQGNFGLDDLIESLWCDAVYRNEEFTEGTRVFEPGQLWYSRGDTVYKTDKVNSASFTPIGSMFIKI